MNASASALIWRPPVRSREATGRSCGASRTAPSTHLAFVAGSLPAPPLLLSPSQHRPDFLLYPSRPRASRPKPRAFSSCPKSVSRPTRSRSVKPSQARPCRPPPRTRDPKPKTRKRVKVSQGRSSLSRPRGHRHPAATRRTGEKRVGTSQDHKGTRSNKVKCGLPKT